MASLYNRGRKIWISYKVGGKWKCVSTGYRVGNKNEERAAKRLADDKTKLELLEKPVAQNNAGWEWVPGWLELRTTPESLVTVGSRWRNLERWLRVYDIPGPRNVTREHCANYPAYRAEKAKAKGKTCKVSTARKDLLLLKIILDEAVRRNYIENNPAEKLGIRPEPAAGKQPWSDAEIRLVAEKLNREHFGNWLHVTFLLGLFQAARMNQCALPLECIDLVANTITYPAELVKGRKPFSQPIDPRLQPTLVAIVQKRQSEGHRTLCDIPKFPSIEWRTFLDSLGLNNLVHHGLRVTWATRACLAGVPMAQAMRFCNHASETVHSVYQRLSVGDLVAVPMQVRLPNLLT